MSVGRRVGNFETELEKVRRRRVRVGLKPRLERIPVMRATLLRPFLFCPLDSGASFHRGQREITKIRGSRVGVEGWIEQRYRLGIMSIRIRIKERSGFWGIWVNHEPGTNGPADSTFRSQSKFTLIILGRCIFLIST